MTTVPEHIKIFHITHLRNLPQIVQADGFWSDAARVRQNLDCEIVGMSRIKERRLHLPVDCHQGTNVGEYVPFYFCPRSIMLYILHRGNHPDIDYREGQAPVVHLQADLAATVRWANARGVRWAFSNGNAGAYLTRFYATTIDLNQVDWTAVRATDWRDQAVRERKQAEFLVYESFPWQLVEKVGVLSTRVTSQVRSR